MNARKFKGIIVVMAMVGTGILAAQAPAEPAGVSAPKPTASPFSVGFRLSWGVGGLLHDSSIVLPIYKSGQTYMLGLGISFKYQLNPTFFVSFDPSYNHSAHYSVLFISPDISSHNLMLPAGLGVMVGANTALIAGVISNYQFSATMFAAQGIGNTASTLQLSDKDLARPGWGGYGGLQHKVTELVTLQFMLEYYRVMINSNLIAGRVGIIFTF